MKRLLIAILVLCLGVGLFACTREPTQFDTETFFETVRTINTPQAAAGLLQGRGLNGYRGTIPDEALLTYEQLLRRMAGEISPSDNIPELFRQQGREVHVNYTALLAQLQIHDQLSSRANTWLGLLASEELQPVVVDGTIVVDYNLLLARMLAWENFEQDYRNFASALQGMGHCCTNQSQELFTLFLLGTAQSPIYSSDGTLNNEVRAAFEVFLFTGQGQGSIYYNALEDAYHIWLANAWTYDTNVRGALSAISQRNFLFSPPELPGFGGNHHFEWDHWGDCC